MDTTFSVQIYHDIKEAVVVLANKLGVTSEQLFTTLVKQQSVKAITSLITLIIIYSLIGACIKGIYSVKWEDTKYDPDPIDMINGLKFWISLVIGAIAVFVGLIVSYDLFSNIITGFFNPEYGAIKEILDVLKGGE